VRDGEREHRAEGVDRSEELGLSGEDRQASDEPEDRDRDVRGLEAWVQAPHALGQLAVLTHRVSEARHADESGVRRDDEDRRGKHAHVDLGWFLEHAEVHLLDDAEDRIARVLPRERGLPVHDRHRREGNDRQERVDHGHRDDDAANRARDRAPEVICLLGEVRDRLDAGVRDHPHRDRDQEVAERRRRPEVDVLDQRLRRENEHAADDHQQHLRHEVRGRQEDVQARRLLDAYDIHTREQRDDGDARDDVARRGPERLPEDPEVVGDEERRDGDRDDVVEHLAPRREERPELVEGVAREGRRPSGLGVHRGGLGVRGGRRGEDQPRNQEHDRGHPEREDRHQPQCVVDRAADVAVGGAEQGTGAEHSLEPGVAWATLGHQPL
jgi:hypothetical protein